jgi:hypothetical protein
MAYKPPVAVYDACVLYPFHLRNLLVQCAVDRLVAARWTDEIHDEWIESLLAKGAGLTRGRLLKTRDLMNNVLPDANVEHYDQHDLEIRLKDPRDRHVVAAAITARASLIVTWNLRDFPVTELARFGLRRQTPDGLLVDLYSAVPDAMIASVANARRNLTRSELAPSEFVAALRRQKLRNFAAVLARHRADI